MHILHEVNPRDPNQLLRMSPKSQPGAHSSTTTTRTMIVGSAPAAKSAVATHPTGKTAEPDMHGPAPSEVRYWFMHVHKTGGTSLAVDLSHLLRLCNNLKCSAKKKPRGHFNLSRNCDLGGCEGFLAHRLREVIAPSPPLIITILRSPSEHVRSLYGHCRMFSQGFNHTMAMGYEEWVMAWANANGNRTRMGYLRKVCWGLGWSPRNNQAPAHISAANQDGEPTEAAMLASVDFVQKRAFHIGITEHYDASLCLLSAKLGRSHRLGGKCTCAPLHSRHAVGTWSLGTITHFKPQSVSSPDTARGIRKLTSVDEALYSQALSRLRYELDLYNMSCLLAGTARP